MSIAEILDGPERRRRWSVEEKLSILAEASRPGATVSGTARRHGLHANQVFRWRQYARDGRLGGVAPVSGFAPVRVVDEARAPSASPSASPSAPGCSGSLGKVEVLLGNGRVVRVDAGIDPGCLSRLVAALER